MKDENRSKHKGKVIPNCVDSSAPDMVIEESRMWEFEKNTQQKTLVSN
jgi:hypothetical protein